MSTALPGLRVQVWHYLTGEEPRLCTLHCCVIDGVFAVGEHGQVHFAEADALTPEEVTALQQQVRARVLRWFARVGLTDLAYSRDMERWDHGGGFRCQPAGVVSS